MKSITSRSLLPALSCSRIWLRRSWASAALESAIVWFWHTRQRSSCASAVTRRSRAGSSCPLAWNARTTRRESNKSLATFRQLLDERAQLLLRDLRRERPDALVADDSLAVDHVGLGHAVDAVVDGDAARRVEGDDLEGIAVPLEPRQGVLARILVVQAHHRGDSRARELAHHRMLDEARRAPRRPHVQHPHRAEHVLLREPLVGLLQERQLDRGRRLADERRRPRARVEPQTDGEKPHQRQETRDDEPEPQTATSVVVLRCSRSGKRKRRCLAAHTP